MSIERKRAGCGITHRRGFLVASAALGAAFLLPVGALAAQIKVLQGNLRINGKRASKATSIRPGDTLETAKGARVVFVVGEDAFLMRGASKLMLEHTSGPQPLLITGLRLLTGGLLASFAPGPRRIETPTATAGIRGTAAYIEASKEETYFCTCYGVVELRDRAGVERKTVISGYHTANMIFANPAERGKMADAGIKNHTDDELILLEQLVGRTSPILERKRKPKGSQTEDAEPVQKPAEEVKAPEDKPREEKKPEDKKPVEEQANPAKAEALQDDVKPLEPAAKQATKELPAEIPSEPAPKPAKKGKGQKPGKARKAKPSPEPAPAVPAAPEKSEIPELGPAPQPPAPPQPPAQEYRLPPPRLDQ
jgi:hypothetical protein